MSASAPPRSRSATPRAEVRPQGIVGTFGPEAVELARLSGLDLDDWQRDAVHLMLSYRDDLSWACREYAEWVARQNGKGAILEARALAGLFLLGEELIMWSAHEVKTAAEGFRRMKQRLATLGRHFVRRGSDYYAVDLGDGHLTVKVNNTNGQEGFEILETGQRLLFVARSKSSGRGFSGDCNIIDESFAYTHAQQEALGPTMRARPNPQTVYTSSPPLDGTPAPMHRLRKRAESGDPGRLGYRDWGAGRYLEELRDLSPADLAAFLNGVEVWYATNPALGIRVTPEAMQDDRDSMSDEGFAREILGCWPRPVELGAGTVDPEAWATLGDPASQLVGKVRFAVDVSPDRARSTIAVAGRRADGLFHVEQVRADYGTGWVVDVLRGLTARWDCGPVLVDPRSPAGSLIPALIEAGVELELITTAELGQATGALLDLIANGGLRHIEQDTLTAAVLGGRLRPLGDAYAWARKDTTVDITPLVAATIALHGAAATEPEAPEPWVMTDDDWDEEDED